MAPNPIDDEELYFGIVLGGATSPGQVTLSGHDRKIGWDVKKGAGQSGASTREDERRPHRVHRVVLPRVARGHRRLAIVRRRDPFDDQREGSEGARRLPPRPIRQWDHERRPELVWRGSPRRPGRADDHRQVPRVPPAEAEGRIPEGSATKAKKPTEPDPNADLKRELAAVTEQYKQTPWSGGGFGNLFG